MSLWIERLNELQHYYTLLGEVEQHRLARKGMAGHRKTWNISYRIITRFEPHQTAWVKLLQKLYETAVAASTIKGVYL